MIPFVVAMLVASPMGYLSGDVYHNNHPETTEILPAACALIMPLGAVIAIFNLLEAENKEN